MNKPYTIIQCSNYFEHLSLKEYLELNCSRAHYYCMDNSYTIKSYGLALYSIPSFIKLLAPTANITQVSFRNGRAIYTKLKD